MPPYCETEGGGFVCNIAIDRYATATLTSDGDSVAPSSADASPMNAALRRSGPHRCSRLDRQRFPSERRPRWIIRRERRTRSAPSPPWR